MKRRSQQKHATPAATIRTINQTSHSQAPAYSMAAVSPRILFCSLWLLLPFSLSFVLQPRHHHNHNQHTIVSSSSWLMLSNAKESSSSSSAQDQQQQEVSSSSPSPSPSPPPSDELLDQILAVATDAAKKAGEIILGNAGGAEVAKVKANSKDLLTLIDPLCEKTIQETVLAAFPDHDFLGEEGVDPGKEASAKALESKLSSESATRNGGDDEANSNDWLWIVDPIDGTTNFVHGMPLCMPSIAATYKGQVMVGVIYDCHRDELFTAIKGQGAFMNGERISVGAQESIGDAVIAMGSPPGEESLAMSLKGISALMPVCRTIRMLGSAAIMLAWVANGRLTCYWEYDLSSWDIAAGALLVTEAGGKFTNLKGEDFDVRNRKICASNGAVHDEVLRVLQEDAGII